jgi:16S rRNA (cytosine1402-N4)-methyltransferase
MSGVHRPVMVAEVVAALTRDGTRGGRFLDATLGLGGHSEALLSARPDARVVGIDRDGEALALAAERLAPFGDRFRAARGNFRDARALLAGEAFDGAVLDLGVSSLQLDTAARGFSFQRDAPLDMRMDPSAAGTAADLVNRASPAELERIFREHGDERRARRIAEAIREERQAAPIRTTMQLAGIVARAAGGSRFAGRIHPATRVFMALRMEVNDEPGALREGLGAVASLLAPGGRLAVISFHSAEDREVKNRFRDWKRNGAARLMTPKPLGPGEGEARANPRARSARLRVAEMTGEHFQQPQGGTDGEKPKES